MVRYLSLAAVPALTFLFPGRMPGSTRGGWKVCAVVGLLTLTALMGCPQPQAPVLGVLPAAFNFGDTRTTDSFTIYNTGYGTLHWEAVALPAWASLSREAGQVASGVQTVNISIDRSQLPQGRIADAFLLQSNGGDIIVPLALNVEGPPAPADFQLSTDTLNFGDTANTLTVTLTNPGNQSLSWSLSENLPWLSVSPTSGTTAPGTSTELTFSVNRGVLGPGETQGTVNLTSNAGTAEISVSVLVLGPSPTASVSPTALNFGTNVSTRSLIITNAGAGQLNWSISGTIPWLAVAPGSGFLNGGESISVAVTVDRSGTGLGTHTGEFTVVTNGGNVTVSAEMRVVPELDLVVTPASLDFGSFQTNKLFTISNAGTGTLNWNIDTSGFPSWLSVAPQSGTAAQQAAGVLVHVDRSGLTPGNYTATIPVASDGGNASVIVQMRVNTEPVLTITSGTLDSAGNPDVTIEGDPLVRLGTSLNTATFLVRNTGTGSLDWNLDPRSLADWVQVSPVSGTINAGEPGITVTVTVNRLNQPEGSLRQRVLINSNGGLATLEITAQVPILPVIGVGPDELIFSGAERSDSFGVTNMGREGTLLRFIVRTNRDWLYVYPDAGTSVGTSSPIKDVQTIGVSIDRGGLGANGDTGEVTIHAVDEAGEVIPEIRSMSVTISVEPVDLIFEAAEAWLRIPSVVRFIFTLRDFRDLAIDVPPEDLVNAFRIFEERVSIEQTETNQYVTDLYRANIAMLLDYSGSMRAAAEELGLDPADPLQAVYEQVLVFEEPNFFSELEGAKRVGLFEFHERELALRQVHSFTERFELIQQALQTIRVADHGATELFPSLIRAANRLADEDGVLYPFDATDVRAILLISDGRLTTPPGLISDLIDILNAAKVRLYAVGWGRAVNNEVLARIAAETGGHYYPTRTDPATGEPILSELRDRLLQAGRDLNLLRVLTYVTLNEESQAAVRVDASFVHPDPDITTVSGSMPEQDLPLGSVVDDVRLGQISLRSSGIQAGAARVVIRADYVPRNVNRFRFNINTTRQFQARIVAREDGGLLDDSWTLSGPAGGNSGTYSLDGPEVLPYGAFGDLIELLFPTPGSAQFTVQFQVDNSVYATDLEPKYFTAPDSLPVRVDAGSLAPALPTPIVSPLALNFGTNLSTLQLRISNQGGSYAYPDGRQVRLAWEVADAPAFVTVNPLDGARATTLGEDVLVVTFNRTIDPGVYAGLIQLSFTGDAANIGTTVSVLVTGQILDEGP